MNGKFNGDVETDDLASIELSKRVFPKMISTIVVEDPASIQVLMFLLDNMDKGNSLMVSQILMSQTLHITAHTISDAIEVLIKRGAIGVGKHGNANIYIVNPHIARLSGGHGVDKIRLKCNAILGEYQANKLFDVFDEAYDYNEVNNLELYKVSDRLVKTDTTNHTVKRGEL